MFHFSRGMIFINLQPSFYLEKNLIMSSSEIKKKKKGRNVLYFFAATAITAAAFIYLVKEGQRIKIQNELLAYEVW